MSSRMLFLAFFLPVTLGSAQAATASTRDLRGSISEVAAAIQPAIGPGDDDLRWRGIEAKLARREVEVVSRGLLSSHQ